MNPIKSSLISILGVSIFVSMILLVQKPDCVLKENGKVYKERVATISLIIGTAVGIIVFFNKCPKEIKLTPKKEIAIAGITEVIGEGIAF